MNIELRILLVFTRSLPPIRGAGWIAGVIKDFYNRKARDTERVDVFGRVMELDPSECVDGALLFCPQLYDRRERKFLASFLKDGDVFIDMGANVGAYSLYCSSLVGPRGRVISVEVDPFSAARLKRNIGINGVENIFVSEVGLSDRGENIEFYPQTNGNRGGSSFFSESISDGIVVQCTTLRSLYEVMAVKECAAWKVDIEGFEYRVLKDFFSSADSSCHPRAILIEVNPAYKSSNFLAGLLAENKYLLFIDCKLNQIWVKS